MTTWTTRPDGATEILASGRMGGCRVRIHADGRGELLEAWRTDRRAEHATPDAAPPAPPPHAPPGSPEAIAARECCGAPRGAL